jgi:hypothetical protein
MGGGPSEIAAVSVGVYVIDHTGQGFAAIKAKVVAQGAEIGKAAGEAAADAAGTAAGGGKGGKGGGGRGKNVGGGIFSGFIDQMRGARGILIGTIAGPLVIAQAYKAGQAIRDALLGGLENALYQRIEEMEKQVAARFMRIVENNTKMMDIVNANLNRLGQPSAFDTEEIKLAAQRFNDINEKIMKDQADTWGAWFRSGPIIGGLLGFEEEHKKLMERLRLEQRSISNELGGLRAKAKRLAQETADETKRRGAEGAGSIDNLAFDIGSIRRMTAIQIAQKTGSIPAGGLSSRD